MGVYRCGILVVHGSVWEVWDSSTWEAYGRCGILVVHGGVWEVWDSSSTWRCVGGVGF